MERSGSVSPLLESGQAGDCFSQKSMLEVMLCHLRGKVTTDPAAPAALLLSPESQGRKSGYPEAAVWKGGIQVLQLIVPDKTSVIATCLSV